MKDEIKVKLDIHSICTLECLRTECTHNLVNFRNVEDFGCNLKNISLDSDGKCIEFAEMRKQ